MLLLPCSGLVLDSHVFVVNTCFCPKCKTDLDHMFSPVQGMQLEYDIPLPSATTESTPKESENKNVATEDDSSHPEGDPLAEENRETAPEVTVESESVASEAEEKGDTAPAALAHDASAALDDNATGLEAASGADETPAADNATEASGDDENTENKPVSHSYEHKMILCRAVEEDSSDTESAKPTVEEQLVSLNERFDSLESKIMERLEQMMAKLLGPTAVTPIPAAVVTEEITN